MSMNRAALPALVHAVRELAPEIREFTLVPERGGDFPGYSAGSHTLLSLMIAGRKHHNAYSLLGDPGQRDHWRIAVQRQRGSRGGSEWLHANARPGLRIEVAPPVNLFPLVRTARHHVLVAGGIGITPILSQARELARLGASFELHYAYRGPENGVYTDELTALGAGRIHHHDTDHGAPPDFDVLLAAQPLGTHLYICGPLSMVEACMQAGARQGWPAEHLHSEQFLAPGGGEPFEVELRRSGKRFTVPGDMSLLDAIEQQGVEAPSLCRGGACGQCELEVLEANGALVHNDVYLSPTERASGRKIMPCVSRLNGMCLVLNL